MTVRATTWVNLEDPVNHTQRAGNVGVCLFRGQKQASPMKLEKRLQSSID